MSRIIPLSGSESSRTTQAAQISDNEVHSTDDQRRLFLENAIVAPVWHGAIASQAAMLALHNRKSATTISAASSDNSFNDSGAGFPAWIAGDFITVAGFTDPANNGLVFEIVSRTASKIVVTGGTALVVEAAGATITITKNGTRGCWPGDKCRRSDFGTIWECISNCGELIGDWVEITTDRIGMIVMWSGAFANIPTGWALCDGTGGTPNLYDKFIMGTVTEGALGTTGGAATHQHALTAATTAAAGAHTHGFTSSANAATPDLLAPDVTGTGVAAQGTTDSGGSHSHGLTGSTDAGSTLPPYYLLAFIKRVA